MPSDSWSPRFRPRTGSPLRKKSGRVSKLCRRQSMETFSSTSSAPLTSTVRLPPPPPSTRCIRPRPSLNHVVQFPIMPQWEASRLPPNAMCYAPSPFPIPHSPPPLLVTGGPWRHFPFYARSEGDKHRIVRVLCLPRGEVQHRGALLQDSSRYTSLSPSMPPHHNLPFAQSKSKGCQRKHLGNLVPESDRPRALKPSTRKRV